MTPEFNLIHQFFTRPTTQTDLSIGDDAALVSVANGMQLAISTDMLVAGTHFFADCAPYQLGWKSLAVNISDMAAMGAQPKWATLAIALPNIDTHWLSQFSDGFFACASQHNVDLIGGDTTRGPLTISVQIMGEVPISKAIKRSGAQPNDDIWVSGELGNAALGLAYLQNTLAHNLLNADDLALCLQALHAPSPRSALGLSLRGIATSCIDISDGLLADLGHILNASNCGATLGLAAIPCINFLKSSLENPTIQDCILAGGDDYELCFTAPKSARESLTKISAQLNCPLTLIGEICIGTDLNVTYQNKKVNVSKKGFDHFS
ncbi:MAG: thiamine-phosphate kinase [Methylotenera sp.]|nr:MAG: thiamine-phosphate kinase [Methylotenera sp.]